MALDNGLDKRLQQLNGMLGTQPTSVLGNRDLDRMLSVIGANKAVPQKAAIVNMNNAGYAVPGTAPLNGMLGTQPTSLLGNRDLDRMLSVIGANKAVPQKAPIVNMNNSGYAVPGAVSSTVPLTATSVTQPQYISNAFTPQGLSGSFLTASQSTADLFNDYEKAINPYLQDYNKNSFALGNDVLSQLNQQKTNYLNQFGPQGTIQTQLDDYYKGLGQYLGSQQAANQALQSNEALRATGSSAAAGIAGNKVAEDYLGKVNEANKQRLAEQTNIYQQLNNYMNQFTTQYANTKDKYVLDTYKRLFDFKNQLAGQILQQQNALVNAQLTKANTPGTGTATPAKTATVGGKTVNLNNVTNAIKGGAKPLSAAAAELAKQGGITKKVNIGKGTIDDKGQITRSGSTAVTPSSGVMGILKNLGYIK